MTNKRGGVVAVTTENQVNTTKQRHEDAAHGIIDAVIAVKPQQTKPVNELFKVIKRNGQIVPFDANKITLAMTKAFLYVEGGQAAESSRVHAITQQLTDTIITAFLKKNPSGGTLHIEDIQDQGIVALMRAGQYEVATQYILYRDQQRKKREAQRAEKLKPGEIRVTLPNGKMQKLDQARLETVINEACTGVVDVDAQAVINETKRNLFDGVAQQDVARAMILAARILVEREPNYTYVTARLLLDELRSEALSFLGVAQSATFSQMQVLYPKALPVFIEKGIKLGRINPLMASKFDFAQLGKALDNQRDLQFNYLSMQTLYDRYFIHEKQVRYELPQIFFMRVAMGLALAEDKPTERAIAFYHQLSSFDYMSSTPTLFNAGTTHSQLSSCYLTTVSDDLHDIYGAIRDNALLQKYAGGLGNDWTPVRGMNAYIKGTNGISQGVIPFLKVANDTAIAVNQGGKRKGAVVAYLETWHVDIEEFLELRKNSGDDRRRTHDMNTANWVPDLFMKRVIENEEWTLFTPDEVPDLHEKYGEAFEQAYVAYEKKAEQGNMVSRKIAAVTLWRKMLGMLFETGHPWVTFKDPCNVRSPQQHCGVIHSSNLCTEITLNTSADEIAVCNLGSVNVVAHLSESGDIDHKKLRHTIHTAVRMLDNVIDINYYAVPQARRSNFRHRPIGLGLMGFQDALYIKRTPYESEKAVEFADELMEAISYYAIEASSELAEERGTYETFEGSLWSKGILPIDSVNLLKQLRGEHLQQNTIQRLDWSQLRNRVRTKGMRNSNVMAIAPTATIANIVGVSQSIEPMYQNLYVKSNLSGEFTVVNPYLIKDLKVKGLWDEVMINDLKYYDGSVKNISRIPEDMKKLYATAFEVDPMRLVDAASCRQKWIDQSQSLNLYVAKPSGKKLDQLYRYAWKRGLKTTYYLRSLGATSAEKSTGQAGELNAVKITSAAPKVCSILDPECEACQ